MFSKIYQTDIQNKILFNKQLKILIHKNISLQNDP